MRRYIVVPLKRPRVGGLTPFKMLSNYWIITVVCTVHLGRKERGNKGCGENERQFETGKWRQLRREKYREVGRRAYSVWQRKSNLFFLSCLRVHIHCSLFPVQRRERV